MCPNPIGIDCRTTEGHQKDCSIKDGYVCEIDKNGGPCPDVMVRYLCPVPSKCKVYLISYIDSVCPYDIHPDVHPNVMTSYRPNFLLQNHFFSNCQNEKKKIILYFDQFVCSPFSCFYSFLLILLLSQGITDVMTYCFWYVYSVALSMSNLSAAQSPCSIVIMFYHNRDVGITVN